MVYHPKYALVKFNGGRGALLCNKCSVILRQDFDPMDIEDRQYLCINCTPRHRSDPLSDPNSFKGADNTWFLECPDKRDHKCDCEKHADCKYSKEYYLRKTDG